MHNIYLIIIILSCIFPFIGFSNDLQGESSMSFILSSKAFNNNESIPIIHTCDGKNISPDLEWSVGPEGTCSFALICDDPDASMKAWVHWIIFNIPKDQTSLPADLPPAPILKNGAKNGMNDFQNYGYGGPCPPRGTHHYHFALYALDTTINAQPGIKKEQLLTLMKGHILAEARLIGKYERR